jgi:hypothetical protein
VAFPLSRTLNSVDEALLEITNAVCLRMWEVWKQGESGAT